LNLTFARSLFGIQDISDILKDLSNSTTQIFFHIYSLMVSVTMLVLLYERVCRRYKMSLKDGFMLKRPEDFNWFSIIPIVAAMLVVVFLMKDLAPDIKKIPLYSYISTTPGLIFFICSAITIAPVYEELFYRGYLYPAIARAWDTRTAIIIVSLFFTIAHIPQLWGDWAGLFVIFCVGLFLTILRAQTGSTLVCVFTHLAYNASLVIMNLLIGVKQ